MPGMRWRSESVRQLEQRPVSPKADAGEVAEVDKSIVVVGGFAEERVDRAEAIVRELMQHVQGFRDVEVSSKNAAIA